MNYVGIDRREDGCKKPRLLHLERDIDISGVSGIGIVASGVEFSDGRIVLNWNTVVSSITIYNSVEDLIAISGHDGATRVVFDDD